MPCRPSQRKRNHVAPPQSRHPWAIASVGAGNHRPDLGRSGGSQHQGDHGQGNRDEFHIALSVKHFKPGTYIFLAENKGQSTHALEITGPGLHNATTKLLAPGQDAKLKVTFKSGKYDVFCPVPGHKALGMNVNLVISASGGGSTTATTKAASGGYGY